MKAFDTIATVPNCTWCEGNTAIGGTTLYSKGDRWSPSHPFRVCQAEACRIMARKAGYRF